MKISYIINDEVPLALPRGDAIHITNFIKNFTLIGNKVFLLKKYIKDEGIENSNNVKFFQIQSTNNFWKLRKISYNIQLYQEGSRILGKEKPSILYERISYSNFGGLLLANKYNIPYVLEINAPMLYERGRHHSYFSRLIEKKIEMKLFNKAVKIIVVSTPLRDYLSSLGVPEKKITVIPNGADGELFNNKISGMEIKKKYNLDNKNVVCYSGSLDQQWQGIEDILLSANIINSIDIPVQFLIIGDISDQEKLISNAPENVIFTDAVKHSEVPKYLAAADILLAPYKLESDFKDIGYYNSPIKIFEYMAMGKAIITSNIGQILEVIEHNKTGLLIEPGNYKELANNIQLLLENKTLRGELGSNARNEFEKNYTWEKNARKIMSVFNEILENKEMNI